jgi:nitrate reductase beta subunit
MSGFGYSRAETNQDAYNDGWIRTFRAKDIPKFQGKELKMFREWIKKDQFQRIYLYLTLKKYGYILDDEMIGFVVRSILSGEI